MAERKTAARRQAFSAPYDLSAHHQHGGWLRSFPYLRPDLLREGRRAVGRYQRMNGTISLINGVPHSHAREIARYKRQQEALQRRRDAVRYDTAMILTVPIDELQRASNSL